MVTRWTAVCLVALALFGSFCDAQWQQKPAKQEQSQQTAHVPQQAKQSFEAKIQWKFPLPPPPEPKIDVPIEVRHPVPAATIAVECLDHVANVEVKKDMFKSGQLINPADLTLGNCPAVGEDTTAQVLFYQAQLHECGSVLTTTETSLIYTFVMNYNPNPIGGSNVVRTRQAAVIVECHYPRKHNVSSLPIDPLWIPFSAARFAEEFLYFTLTLRTDDWQYERPHYQYYLGDMINIEATVKQYFHVPLIVYVDSCVATLTSDVNSSPRYAFIENHGCLIDARITGSDSKFMSRTDGTKLAFQLEAFRFQNADSGVMFITCHLKATSANHGVDSEHRACSYINGWKEVTGADAACGSCESAGLPANPGQGGGSVGGGGQKTKWGDYGSQFQAGVQAGAAAGGHYGGAGAAGAAAGGHYGGAGAAGGAAGGAGHYGGAGVGAGTGSYGHTAGHYGGGGGASATSPTYGHTAGFGGGLKKGSDPPKKAGGNWGWGAAAGAGGAGAGAGGAGHYGGAGVGAGGAGPTYGHTAGHYGGAGVGAGPTYGHTAGAGGGVSVTKPGRKIRDVSDSVVWEGHVTLGPIPILEKEATVV